MNQVWLQVFAVLLIGGMVKSFFPNPMMWVGIDLLALGIAYSIMKRNAYYLDVKKNMTFLSGITAVNIIVDIGVLSADMGNIALLVFLAYWMFWGKDR